MSRAFTDFKKISIFISKFGFYFFTKDGFQISARLLIGWGIFMPTDWLKSFLAWFLPGRVLQFTKNRNMPRTFSIRALICNPLYTPPITPHLWLINYDALSKNWIWKVGNDNDVFQNSLFNFWRTFRNYFLFMIVTPLTTYSRILYPQQKLNILTIFMVPRIN